jgi:hypothetical protein
MNRVMIQEGYSLPFDGARRTRRRTKRKTSSRGKHRRTKKVKAAGKKFGARMRACAKQWNRMSPKKRAHRKWHAFLKKCL